MKLKEASLHAVTSGYGPVSGACEHDGASYCVKFEKLASRMRDCWLLVDCPVLVGFVVKSSLYSVNFWEA